MSDDVRHGIEQWREAFDAAEEYEWDSVDSGEKCGPVARWLCDELYGHEKVGQDAAIIAAAFETLTDKGEREFTTDRLLTVVQTYRGETENDFEVLARQYAREDYTGPDNPEDNDWDGFRSEEDYEKWFVAHGQGEGETCVASADVSTLYWFDAFKM